MKTTFKTFKSPELLLACLQQVGSGKIISLRLQLIVRDE